jgi:predicted transposase YdaD
MHRNITYHQIHTRIDYRFCMHDMTDPTALLEKYIAAIPVLNLDGDELEEYSSVLLRLQNQVETGEPSDRVISECLAWMVQFESQAA